MKPERVYDLEMEAKAIGAKLRAGDMTVDVAKQLLGTLRVRAQFMAIRLEHARISGRIGQSEDALPHLLLAPSEE